MGCCCSKKGIEGKENEEKENEEKERGMKRPRWEPPPPPPEEETVKEVLSETPKAKPKAPSSPVLKPVEKEANKDEQLEKKLIKPKLMKSAEILPADDRSEQPQPSDDGCSLSEVSNATSAATMREEISVNSTTSSVPRMPRSNYNAGNGYNRRSYSGELFGGGGSRRERSSPAVVTGLGCRSGRTSPGPQPRNRSLSGNVNGVKRDVGERSGRRSLSPGAKRRDVTGPGMHGERFGVNRGVPLRRVPALPPNKTPVTPPATTQLSDGGGGGNPGTEGKESLENPSVSLECFIFL